MRIPLRAGRWFTSEDPQGTAPVVVIDENLARDYWPGQNPIGHYLRFGRNTEWSQVIGVVGDVRLSSWQRTLGKERVYQDYVQNPVPMPFCCPDRPDASALKSMLQCLGRSIDGPTQTVFDMEMLHSPGAGISHPCIASSRLVAQRFRIPCVDVADHRKSCHGLISYTPRNEPRKIGIRMALGAERVQIVGMVLQSAAKLMAAGLVLGIVLSFLARIVADPALRKPRCSEFPVVCVPVLALATAGMLGLR